MQALTVKVETPDGKVFEETTPVTENWDYIESVSKGIKIGVGGTEIMVTITVDFDPPLLIKQGDADNGDE